MWLETIVIHISLRKKEEGNNEPIIDTFNTNLPIKAIDNYDNVNLHRIKRLIRNKDQITAKKTVTNIVFEVMYSI